jgi:DNA-binding NtrC family response regulator
VVKADSASSAFAVMTRDRIDLIISDVHMPGLLGPELLSHLRASGIQAPVLFISGDLDVATVQRSLNVPQASFLPKPFTADELLTAVSASMRW